MELTINGQTHSFPEAEITVSALLNELGFSNQPVLVELNGRALFPREFAVTPVREGDRLELIRLAAGG